MGVFDIPINALKIATGEDALRALDQRHISELRREMLVEYSNGHEVCLPPAIGSVNVDLQSHDPSILRDMLEEGELGVQIVDGNHTTFVLKDLHETYPEAVCFQKRYFY